MAENELEHVTAGRVLDHSPAEIHSIGQTSAWREAVGAGGTGRCGSRRLREKVFGASTVRRKYSRDDAPTAVGYKLAVRPWDLPDKSVRAEQTYPTSGLA
jgi:hypothetical protein